MVYGRVESGHRAVYLDVAGRMLGAERASLHDLFFSRAPVLFLVMDRSLLLYGLASVFRALMRRRTVGLLFHPLPLATSSAWKHRVARLLLRRLKIFRGVKTLTILPFDVVPGLASIADGWIYDVQFWDLTEAERRQIETLRDRRRLNGRLVLSAIGAQSRRKAFDLFAATYAGAARLRERFQFIACGRIAPALAGHAAAFAAAGGVAVDREISETELLGSYAASDAVWCFDATVFDHGADALGRAVQLGIPVVVRRNSVSHRLCVIEEIPHVATTAETVADRLITALPPRDRARGEAMASRFAARSEATLREALGLRQKG